MSDLQRYIPNFEDLTVAQVEEARAFLRLWVRAYDADLATGENSPFGDAFLRPAAAVLSAMNVAVERLVGDHSLQNIADGGAYDCETALNFVRNFHPTLTSPQFSRGYARLIFSTDAYREIDRGIQLQFTVLNGVTAGTTAEVFYPLLFSAGPLVIRPAGSSWRADENCVVLKQLNESEFAVDIPVYGSGNLSVPAGTAAAVSQTVSGLLRVTAVGAFATGSDEQSLVNLAKKSTTQAFASSLNARFGAVAFLQREFPDLSAASVTIPGDAEMVRETVTPLGIAKPAMDIWVRGNTVGVVEKAQVRLPFYAVQGSDSVRRFIGKLALPGFPILIEDIAAVGAADVSLGIGSDAVRILSASLNPSAAPALACAHSVEEELVIGISMPTDSAGNDLIALDVAADGTESAVFEFTYRSDSAIEAVNNCLRSRDVHPVNVGVLARGMIPVWVKSLTVSYRRSAGSIFKAAQAREEIVRYINSIRYPEQASDAYITDSVRFAGGTFIQVQCQADLVLTLADKVRRDVLNPATSWNAIIAAADDVPLYRALTLQQANFTAVDPALGTVDALYYAVGIRNAAFFIDGDNIHFEEVR